MQHYVQNARTAFRRLQAWLENMPPAQVSMVAGLCAGVAIALLFFLVFTQSAMMTYAPIHEAAPAHPGRFAYRVPVYQLLAFLPALALVGLLEAAGRLTVAMRQVIVCVVMLGALFAAGTYMLGSIDMYYYVAYGRKLAILNMSPYSPLMNARADRIIGHIPPIWLHVPSFYGPTAILLFAFLNLLSPPYIGALLLTYKIAWFFIFVLLAWVLYQLVKNRPFAFTRWLCVCGSPGLWLLALRDGHLELLMLALFALALLAAERGAWRLTGVALGMLCATKAIALPVMPFFVWHAFRSADAPVGTLRAKQVLIGFFAYMAPLYILFQGADWPGLLNVASNMQACPQLIPMGMIKLMNKVQMPRGPWRQDFVHAATSVILCAALAWMAFRVMRARHRLSLEGITGGAMTLVFLSTPYTMAWYILWPLIPVIVSLPSLPYLFGVTALYSLYAMYENMCVARDLVFIGIALGAIILWLGKMTAEPETKTG